jgi:hypothetical protein
MESGLPGGCAVATPTTRLSPASQPTLSMRSLPRFAVATATRWCVVCPHATHGVSLHASAPWPISSSLAPRCVQIVPAWDRASPMVTPSHHLGGGLSDVARHGRVLGRQRLLLGDMSAFSEMTHGYTTAAAAVAGVVAAMRTLDECALLVSPPPPPATPMPSAPTAVTITPSAESEVIMKGTCEPQCPPPEECICPAPLSARQLLFHLPATRNCFCV